MDMRVEYSLAAQDYYEFNMAYMKHRKSLSRPVKGLGMWAWMAVYIGVLMVVMFAMPSFNTEPAATAPAKVQTPGQWLLGLMPCGVILIIMGGFIWWLRRGKLRYRRAFEESTRLREPHVLEMKEEGITIRTAQCVTTMGWGHFLKFVETAGTFVLFSDAQMGHIVPKRAFGSEEEMKAFRALCQARVGLGVRGFPVEVGR